MHKRDNRRTLPSHRDSHFERGTPPRDPRELRWERNGAGRQIMQLDGESVAEVMPYGPPRWDVLGEPVQPHNARLLGSDRKEHEFRSLDEARFFCEGAFARAAA